MTSVQDIHLDSISSTPSVLSIIQSPARPTLALDLFCRYSGTTSYHYDLRPPSPTNYFLQRHYFPTAQSLARRPSSTPARRSSFIMHDEPDIRPPSAPGGRHTSLAPRAIWGSPSLLWKQILYQLYTFRDVDAFSNAPLPLRSFRGAPLPLKVADSLP